jgi:hypothetical protein
MQGVIVVVIAVIQRPVLPAIFLFFFRPAPTFRRHVVRSQIGQRDAVDFGPAVRQHEFSGSPLVGALQRVEIVVKQRRD